MLRANPDPGILKIHTINVLGEDTYFVNAFAAIDATSTLAIWQRVKDLGYLNDKVAVIMNCRQDRMDRTMQFAEDVLPLMPAISSFVWVRGQNRSDAYHKGMIITEEFITFKGEMSSPLQRVEVRIAGKVIFGVGNIHGLLRNSSRRYCVLNPRGKNYVRDRIIHRHYNWPFLSLLYTEITGILPAGLVVAGYFALMFNHLYAILGILFISCLTYLIVTHVVSRFVILYGRRKFVAMITVGILIKLFLTTSYRTYPMKYTK